MFPARSAEGDAPPSTCLKHTWEGAGEVTAIPSATKENLQIHKWKSNSTVRPHGLLTQSGVNFTPSHFLQPVLKARTPHCPQLTLREGLPRNALRIPRRGPPPQTGIRSPPEGAAPHLREGRKLGPRPAPAGGPGLREPGGGPGPAGGGGGATSRRAEPRRTGRSRVRRGSRTASPASARCPGRRHAAPAPTNPRGERVLPLRPSRRVRRGAKKLHFPAALAAKRAGRNSSPPISAPPRPPAAPRGPMGERGGVAGRPRARRRRWRRPGREGCGARAAAPVAAAQPRPRWLPGTLPRCRCAASGAARAEPRVRPPRLPPGRPPAAWCRRLPSTRRSPAWPPRCCTAAPSSAGSSAVRATPTRWRSSCR